jgi:hypothetical protein
MRETIKRTSDEIIELIAGQIDKDHVGVQVAVRSVVNFLHALDEAPPLRGRRTDNIEDFRALDAQLSRLQRTLAEILSPSALCLLFSDEDDVIPNNLPSAETQQQFLIALQQFTVKLASLRKRCKYLIEVQPGDHGSAGVRERLVAIEAWQLLAMFGKKRAGGTAESLYGRIASLLWEAMTGEIDKDLQRACKAVLKDAKDGNLLPSQRGPTLARRRLPNVD